MIEKEYKDILVVRIFGIGREKKVKIPEDTTIYTIAPTVSLGSILDFNPKRSKIHLKRGYFDTMRVIYGLAGKYIILMNRKRMLLFKAVDRIKSGYLCISGRCI